MEDVSALKMVTLASNQLNFEHLLLWCEMSKLNKYQACATIVGSIITIFMCIIAVIALIPAFGQWLSPREPQSNPVENPTIQKDVFTNLPSIICQGTNQTCLAPSSICTLSFYQFGGEEKTFLFSTDKQVWVKDFNGTLFCWPIPPTFDECCTDHPTANIDEVQKAGVSFSINITPIDPNTLR